MSRLDRFGSSWIAAVLCIVIMGVVGAYRAEKRRSAIQERERDKRLQNEVQESIGKLDIDLSKPPR